MLRNFGRVGAATAACVALMATSSLAAGSSGADAVKDRIAHMKGLGAAAKALGDQFRSGNPDSAIVRGEAAKIATAAQSMRAWFPRGSGPEAGVKTRALPAIWTDATGFAAAQQAFVASAGKLNAAASTGDMAATGAAMKDVGAGCKGCHDKYRKPES